MTESEEIDFAKALVRLDTKLLGFVIGVLFALAIFAATNWLVVMGGYIDDQGEAVVGPHLALLGQFFIGYKVTFWGSIVGALYGFAVGSIVGAGISSIYNKLSSLRKFDDVDDANR
jgi:hypothetical protein